MRSTEERIARISTDLAEARDEVESCSSTLIDQMHACIDKLERPASERDFGHGEALVAWAADARDTLRLYAEELAAATGVLGRVDADLHALDLDLACD